MTPNKLTQEEREMLLLLNERYTELRKDHEELKKIVWGILAIPLSGFLMALVYLVWNTAK